MANIKATFREMQKGIRIPMGVPHVLSIIKGKGRLIEMEDVNFHFDSAVLLPDPRCGNNPDIDAQDRITGLSVLRACYLHAEKNPSEVLLIAGHADTSGKPDYNLTLSAQRSENVRLALAGERAKWADNCDKKHQVEDFQAILKWIDERFGWGTDPGEIDNTQGEKTNKAVRIFQQRYNKEFKKNIPVNSTVTKATWESFFDLYMQGLRELMDAEEEDLIAARGRIKFLDDAHNTVGCGENHPIDQALVDEFRSTVNRRVELLFFDPQDLPPALPCHPAPGKCKPELCQIYGAKGLFDFAHIPCDAVGGGAGALLQIASTLTSDSDSLDLEIEDAQGEVARTIKGDEAQRDGRKIIFTVDPATLPAKVRFNFLRDGEEVSSGALVSPKALRDALSGQSLGDASDVVAGNDPVADTRVAGPGGGGQASGIAVPQAFTPGDDLRVVVLYDTPGHFLLQQAFVGLSKSDPVLGSRTGKHVFDVNAIADEVQLDVKIQDVLALTQKFQIIRNTDFSKGPTFGVLKGNQDPRITDVSYGEGNNHIIEIRLDLTFLDVTNQNMGTNPTLDGFKIQNQEGCKTVVMEHTGGRPAAWAVVIPPNLDPSADEADLFLFFMHELEFAFTSNNSLYTSTLDLDYSRLDRYHTVQQAVETPSNLLVDQDGRYVLGDVALTFPLFGWARQLRQSGKKAAMVIPFPHGTDFGFMNQPTRSARRILRSMIRCLQGEKHIGTKRAGTQRLGRMAVGGWSSGTDTLFSWIKGTITDDAPLSKSVREIYFFDGKEPTRAALTVPGPAKSWFKDDRRLRLIGTANTEVQSILLAKNLANDSILEDELAAGNSSPSAPVLAIPGRDDHWFKNALYIQALAPKPGSSKPLAMKLRPPGSPLSNPPRDVTDSSNVFLVSETRTGGPAKTGVVLMSPNGGPSQPVATVSQEEAAYFLNFFILPGLTNGGPITSEAQFTEAIRVMKETGDPREKVRIFQHRHAWSVIGGLTGFKGRSGFTGHLQICLELSGFK